MNATFTVWQSPDGAHVRANFSTLAEAEFSAKQFAAAPELLAALSDVLVSLEPHETPGDSAINAAITFARAAIAIAKGEA